MRILFAILILALVALLWASIAIAQHVRRVRRRRRRAAGVDEPSRGSGLIGLTALPPAASATELSFKEVRPYSEAAVERPSVAPPPIPDVEDDDDVVESFHHDSYHVMEPVTEAKVAPAAEESLGEGAAEPNVEVSVDQESPAAAEHHAAENAGDVADEPKVDAEWKHEWHQSPEPAEDEWAWLGRSPVVEIAALPVKETESVVEPWPSALVNSVMEDVPRAVTAPAVEPVAQERVEQKDEEQKEEAANTRGFPKPVRAAYPKHPLASLSKKMERPDWAYFNKDLGDLTDPYEAPRSRIKDRTGS